MKKSAFALIAFLALAGVTFGSVSLGIVDNGTVATGYKSYTLTATGVGITTLSKFTIANEVYQYFGVDGWDFVQSDSAITNSGLTDYVETTDSYVMFGNLRLPDCAGIDWGTQVPPETPAAVTVETIGGEVAPQVQEGLGSLNNFDQANNKWDSYLKTGAPSATSQTVNLFKLVLPSALDVANDLDISLTLYTATNYNSETGEADITQYDLTWPQVEEEPWPGDANNNGTTNFDDFTILLSNYNKAGSYGWGDGDFNDDTHVNFDDFTILLSKYNTSKPASSAVPEPSTVVMLILGALCLAGYRLRK